MTGKEKTKKARKAKVDLPPTSRSGTPPIPAGRGRKYQPPRSATTPPIPAGRGRDEKLTSWRVWIWLLVALLSLIMLYGCTRMVYVPVESKTTETITVEVHDTIVEVEMPSERVEVETTDSVSVLTAERATSRAEVSGGKLRHSLYVFPQSVPVTVPTTTVTKARMDSVPYPVEVEKIVEVVPGWSWISLIFSAVMISLLSILLLRRIKD